MKFKWNPFARKAETYSADAKLSHEPPSWLREAGRSAGLPSVSETSAETFGNVNACIRVVSETPAMLPRPAYRRLTGGGRDRAPEHPAYDILNVSPDGNRKSFNWIESLLRHCNTWGNGFSEIEFTRGGELLACHQIHPREVRRHEFTKSGRLQYIVNGSVVPVPAELMLHFAGPGGDGLWGQSPIKVYGQSAIQLGIAVETFGKAFFGNGARASGTISHPKKLTPTAIQNLRESIDAVHGGPEKFGKWMILEEDTKVTPTSIPPEEAQFLESREFNLQECCRIFRVPPTKVQDHSHSTFSNNEQQNLSWVQDSVLPWTRRFEAEFNMKLFTKEERKLFYMEFLIDGLLRADTATRNSSYATARQWGWRNADEIRELENENPLPDDQGKTYIVPANFVNLASLKDQPAPSPSPDVPAQPQDNQQSQDQPEPAPDAIAVQASLESVQDAVDRMLRFEAENIRQFAKKPADFLSNVDKFYSAKRGNVERAVEKPLKAFLALKASYLPDTRAKMLETYNVMGLSSRFIISGREQILELSGQCSADQLPQAVDAWLEKRAAQSAEMVRSLAT